MNNLQIYVGNLPGLKKPCLYILEGNCITILAHFVNDKAAEKFLNYMNGEKRLKN